jgi:hypothetical protein
MDTFEISATIDGEHVSLSVQYLGKFPDPNYDYYQIVYDKNIISIIKVDGVCEIEIDSGEIDKEHFPAICAKIKSIKATLQSPNKGEETGYRD